MADELETIAAGDKLLIERHGGIAGLRAKVMLTWASLTPAERRSMQDLLQADTAGKAAAPSPGNDRFGYRVTWMRDGKPHRAREVGEDALPAGLAGKVSAELP